MKLILFHVLLALYLVNNSEAVVCKLCNVAAGAPAGNTLSTYRCPSPLTDADSTAANCNTCVIAARKVANNVVEVYKFCALANSNYATGTQTITSFGVLDNSAATGVAQTLSVSDGYTLWNVKTCTTASCNTGTLDAPSSSNVSKMNLFVLLASLVLGFLKFF